MTEKEIGEIRRRVRRERSNMTAIYGCFVNDQKEIVTEYRQSTAMMSENESDRYFGLMRRILSGTVGKNLLDITFRTAQVANSPEHKLLMDLRGTGLKDDELRLQLYRKIIENTHLDTGYLILLGCDTYDVPFKSKDDSTQADNSSEVYTYVMCAVCPVKQTKAALHYVAENKEFHDGGISQVAQAPALGFLFPAFDNRASNIYNAMFYTHDSKTAHAELIDSLFNVEAPKAAAEQKKSFEALLSTSLDSECSMEVVQNVHDQLCQCIELHKEDKTPATLMVSKEQVKSALAASGVSEKRIAKFSVDYDETFGFEAQLHPKNIIDNKKFEIRTPDVSIKVDPARSDLIETRVIGGVKYILICADENVEVNGVSIHIGETEEALV
jgi:hypothetical protein